MFSPFACGFQEVVANFSGPAGTPGTSITPGANDALGSYTEIISDTNLTSDAFGIWLCFHSSTTSTAARPILVNIGADPAGGTAYADIIADLNAACAINFSGSGGVRGHFYYFPLFIKAGTALAARARVGNATASTLRVLCRLFCKPTHPELLRVGRYVDSIGADTANSRGTVITPGTSATEGAYTTLGTLPRPAWWYQQGLSVDDATMTDAVYAVDLADGTAGNERIIIPNQLFTGAGTEGMTGELYASPDCMRDLDSGATLRARASVHIATNDSNISVVAHALGG